MNAVDLKRGAKIAAAVAALIVGAGCGEEDKPGTSQAPLTCLGGNSCSGMSECAGGSGGSACMGMNECAGMGWSYVDTEEECTTAGGTIDHSVSHGA